MQKHLLGSLLVLAFISACETPAPVTMDPAAYDVDYARAQRSGSVIYAERLLTRLIARPDLTSSQRADAQLLRADIKRKFDYDLPGAVADYQSYIAAQAEGFDAAPVQAKIRDAQNRTRAARARLTRLQTLSQWFDDTLKIGGLTEAATRQRTSKITPTEQHTYILREAGYICSGPATHPSIHTFGPEPEYARGLVWCNPGEFS